MSDRICLVSPDDLTREGLARILDSEGFEVVSRADHIDSLSLDSTEGRVVLVVDTAASDYGLTALEPLIEKYEFADFVILCDSFDAAKALDCFKIGVRGLIIKSFNSKPLVSALRLIALGERVFPSQLLDALDWRVAQPSEPARGVEEVAHANLSPRELDVLCCLMAGYPNKTIARQLDVCEATVKVHVKAILRKLNVCNRTQAAMWASSHNVPEAGFASPAAA